MSERDAMGNKAEGLEDGDSAADDKRTLTANCARKSDGQRTFLTRASVDVLVTKYACITL